MGEKITKYEFVDRDGDVHNFTHTERWCRCGGNCEDDTIEYYDPYDGPEAPPYRLEPIVGSELKFFMSELIEMAIESGRMKKVE